MDISIYKRCNFQTYKNSSLHRVGTIPARVDFAPRSSVWIFQYPNTPSFISFPYRPILYALHSVCFNSLSHILAVYGVAHSLPLGGVHRDLPFIRMRCID